MTDSIGLKIIKGVMVVMIPILFILTFAILFLKIAGFDVKEEAHQLMKHLPLLSHTAEKKEASSAAASTIAALKSQVQQLQKDLEAKNQQIASLTGQIKDLETKDNAASTEQTPNQETQAKSETIAQVYQSMDPAKAAAILSAMKTSEAAKYLNMMNNLTKAKILEQMPADQAAKVTPLLNGSTQKAGSANGGASGN